MLQRAAGIVPTIEVLVISNVVRFTRVASDEGMVPLKAEFCAKLISSKLDAWLRAAGIVPVMRLPPKSSSYKTATITFRVGIPFYFRSFLSHHFGPATDPYLQVCQPAKLGWDGAYKIIAS
jgi:hypothetical protein